MAYKKIVASCVFATGLAILAGCTQVASDPILPPPDKNKDHAVVFDIDGTLTPDVLLFWQIRPDAAKAVSLFAERGYQIIYVTARHPLFQFNLLDWMAENKLPQGQLHIAKSDEDRDFPDKFKADVLKQYQAKGWQLDYAYGDSSTDFAAYNAVGINKNKIFGLKRKSEPTCLAGNYSACLINWTEHLDYIKNQ